jgi:DNA phosphorothioation-dependent restriction protein DptH
VPSRISDKQREEIIRLLDEGLPREAIAKVLGVSPGQVSAVAAHLTMGTYDKDTANARERPQSTVALSASALRTAAGEDDGDPSPARDPSRARQSNPTTPLRVLLGTDTRNGEDICWYPSPASSTLNPHLLILGESGSGKTYTVQCICAELVQEGIPVVVFDYGQGFVTTAISPEFHKYASPVELNAARDGIDINPLSIFSSDLHGPINVAQRIADTFSRVYPKVGVQQHAVLRDAILAVFEDCDIRADQQSTWTKPAPTLAALRDKLNALAEASTNPSRRYAVSVANHISTLFVFNTFRKNGIKLDWRRILESGGATFIVQLKGLEHSLERVVTELLLWHLIGYLESIGPATLRCFILLDEAHRLSLDSNSPVERLLREGRKFGVGVILASQQPEDFSSVAYSNTATKLIFSLVDRTGDVARQIALRTREPASIVALIKSLGSLHRGTGIFISNQTSAIVRVSTMEERRASWGPQSA